MQAPFRAPAAPGSSPADRLREQIGRPLTEGDLAHYREVTDDNIRHFAFAAGDANPLFLDPDYGPATRWGGMLAPPCMLFSIGINDAEEMAPATRQSAQADRLPSTFGIWAGATFEWYLPILAGQRIFQLRCLADVEERSTPSGGKQLTTVLESLYRNEERAVVARVRTTEVRSLGEQHTALLPDERRPQPWTKEQFARVDAAYAAERARGSTPLYWEDVQIGDELPSIVRGPYTATDAIAWKMGAGFGPSTYAGAFACRYRAQHLESYTPNELNVPDTTERAHWDGDFARSVGAGDCFDYGPQRCAWLTTMLTNWIGDDGWLSRLSLKLRRFNVQGDAQWCRGRVLSKEQSGGAYLVRCDIWTENQRDDVTAIGEAEVLLPSRAGSPVRLPRDGQPEYPSRRAAAGWQIHLG